jgi:hypothetical protein
VLLRSDTVNLKGERPKHTNLRSCERFRNNCSKRIQKTIFLSIQSYVWHKTAVTNLILKVTIGFMLFICKITATLWEVLQSEPNCVVKSVNFTRWHTQHWFQPWQLCICTTLYVNTWHTNPQAKLCFTINLHYLTLYLTVQHNTNYT